MGFKTMIFQNLMHQGCAVAVPGGLCCLTFVLRQPENLSFLYTNPMLGILDLIVSDHRAPFNFT